MTLSAGLKASDRSKLITPMMSNTTRMLVLIASRNLDRSSELIATSNTELVLMVQNSSHKHQARVNGTGS